MESQHLFPLKQTNSQHIISNSGNLMYSNACAFPSLCWLCVFLHMPNTHMYSYAYVCGGLFSNILVEARFFLFLHTHSFHLHCVAVTLIAENKSSIVRYCTNNKIRSSFRFISNDQIRWASSGHRLKQCIYILVADSWLQAPTMTAMAPRTTS